MKTCFMLLVICYLFFAFNFCFAAPTANDISKFVDQANQGVGAETTDYKVIIANIVRAGLGLVGLVFFMLIFYGGYMWLMARGKDEDIKKAQDTIIAAIIGMVVIVGSYALTNLVFTRLVGGQTSGAPSAGQSEQEAGGAPKGPPGCCLYEARGEDAWSIYNPSHWLSTVTDDVTCTDLGMTCSPPEDTLCGKEYFVFLPDINDAEACKIMADKTATHY